MRRYDIMGYVPRYWCEGSEWFSVYYLFVCIIHMKPLSLLVDTQHNRAVSVPDPSSWRYILHKLCVTTHETTTQQQQAAAAAVERPNHDDTSSTKKAGCDGHTNTQFADIHSPHYNLQTNAPRSATFYFVSCLPSNNIA